MPRLRDVTLTQLAYFVRTAELGTMTDAAAELYVAQSAISTSIAALEKALDTTLLVRRRGKPLALTAQGQSLLPRARAILAALDDAVDEVGPRTLAGRLPVAFFSTIAPFSMPRVLAALAERHEGIVLDIHELPAAEVSRALSERSVEIALTYDIGLDHAEIATEHLALAPLYAAVSTTHPLAAHTDVALEELTEYPLALLDIPVSREYFLGAFRDRRLAPRVFFRSAGFESVRAVVAHSTAFTVLNQRPAHDQTYTGGRLVSIPIRDSPPPLSIALAWLREGVQSRKAAAFAEACRGLFRAPSSEDAASV